MGVDRKKVQRSLISEEYVSYLNGEELPQRYELSSGSNQYPERLLHLSDTPRKLYALGELSPLHIPSLAIVGARKATSYGLECATYFARKAASRGIVVISGGAIGCDMAAHQGALEAGGKTVVVLGSGADVVYPLRARKLFWEILEEKGTLLSEAPWGSPPLAWAFSKRNRIIAALAQATLIVEAGLPSGTFQTADHSLALGNEVLVVPGPIFSKTSKGSNRLLAQGAIPIVDEESYDDALTAIFGPVQGNPFSATGTQAGETQEIETEERQAEVKTEQLALSAEEIIYRQMTERIKKDLAANPMTIDALAGAYRKDPVEIIRLVSTLEVQGFLERLRDGRYSVRVRLL